MNYTRLCEIVASDYDRQTPDDVVAALQISVSIPRRSRITERVLADVLGLDAADVLMREIESRNPLAFRLLCGEGLDVDQMEVLLTAMKADADTIVDVCTETVTLAEREGLAGAAAAHVRSARHLLLAIAARKETSQ